MKICLPNWKQAKAGITKESPAILTITGLISLASTVFFSVRNGTKIKEAVEKKKEELGDDYRKIDGVKASIKPAGPILLCTAATATCMLTSNIALYKAIRHINELTAAYEISNETLMLYKKKLKETLGTKKASEIRDEVNKEIADKENLKNLPAPLNPGQYWFMDTWSHEKFISTVEFVKNARNVFNSRFSAGEDYQSLNDFYDVLGLECRDCGDAAGFTVDQQIPIDFLDPVEVDGQIIVFISYGDGPYTTFRGHRI